MNDYVNAALNGSAGNHVRKEYRDEDSILDQIYAQQICLDFYHADFNVL